MSDFFAHIDEDDDDDHDWYDDNDCEHHDHESLVMVMMPMTILPATCGEVVWLRKMTKAVVLQLIVDQIFY